MKKFLVWLLVVILIPCCAYAEETSGEFVVKMEYTVYMLDVDRAGLYTGEIKDGIPHGYGVFTAINDFGEAWHYLGEWENGTMQGEGGNYWDGGQVMVGTYRDSEFVGGTIVQASEETQFFSEESYTAYLAVSNGEIPDVIEEYYEEIAYKNLARNPEDYLYKLIQIDGIIVQVLGSRKQGYELRVATKADADDLVDAYEDIVCVGIPANVDLRGNLLIDDHVMVYGMFVGDYSYNSTEGTTITIPSVYGFRVDLQE